MSATIERDATARVRDAAVEASPAGAKFQEASPVSRTVQPGSRQRPGFERRPPGLVLFAEDFDSPAGRGRVPEPEIIEPNFKQADLDAARQQGWQAGHDEAAAAADRSHTASMRDAIATIAAQLHDACAQAEAVAQQTAEELARLLLESFATVLPALSARHGEAELRNVVRALLPALSHEPNVSVRLHPSCAEAVTQEIGHADPDLAERLQVIACDTMPPGDIRVVWRGGHAVRDVAALWQQVAAILMPAGLLSYAMTKEAEHVE